MGFGRDNGLWSRGQLRLPVVCTHLLLSQSNPLLLSYPGHTYLNTSHSCLTAPSSHPSILLSQPSLPGSQGAREIVPSSVCYVKWDRGSDCTGSRKRAENLSKLQFREREIGTMTAYEKPPLVESHFVNHKVSKKIREFERLMRTLIASLHTFFNRFLLLCN